MVVICPDCHHSRLLRKVPAGFKQDGNLTTIWKFEDDGCQNCLNARPSSPQAPVEVPRPQDEPDEEPPLAADAPAQL